MDIDIILKRSADLDDSLYVLLELKPYEDSIRLNASKIMCGVAIEHAQSLKMLIAASNYTSAISLARVQYETLVRALWLLYAASDTDVSKIMSDLTTENERKAKNLPMLSDMIKQMDGEAPAAAVDMVVEFKEYSYGSLSSYIHGGIHSVHRHRKGYPVPLIIQVVKMSNGVSTMTAMLLAIISGDKKITELVSNMQVEFKDCLPELKK